MKKGKKRIKILALMAILIGGIGIFFSLNNAKQRTEEEQRNREYEVSLVKTLKSTYKGIQEIKISNPEYSTIPSESWGADITIIFENGQSVSHAMAYNIKNKTINIGIYSKADEEIKAILDSNLGRTSKRVKIIFSNGESGEQ